MVVALPFYSASFSYIHWWHYVMRNAITQCSCLFGKNLLLNRASIVCWNPLTTHHHEIAQFVPCITWCHLYDLSLKPFQVSSFMLKIWQPLLQWNISQRLTYICVQKFETERQTDIFCVNRLCKNNMYLWVFYLDHTPFNLFGNELLVPYFKSHCLSLWNIQKVFFMSYLWPSATNKLNYKFNVSWNEMHCCTDTGSCLVYCHLSVIELPEWTVTDITHSSPRLSLPCVISL